MRMALRHLRKMGYARMGLALRSSIDERVEHHYTGAFLADQQRLSPRERVPLHVVQDRVWSERAFGSWFIKQRPEVVVTHHEEVLDWLARLKISVPNEVGVVHLNCSDPSGRIAGVYQNGPEVGAAAADFLVAMIQRNEAGIPDLAHTILVDGAWVDGKTVLSRTNYRRTEFAMRRVDLLPRPAETLRKPA
jgi:LacI family transcriptional regulator